MSKEEMDIALENLRQTQRQLDQIDPSFAGNAIRLGIIEKLVRLQDELNRMNEDKQRDLKNRVDSLEKQSAAFINQTNMRIKKLEEQVSMLLVVRDYQPSPSLTSAALYISRMEELLARMSTELELLK